MRFRSPVLAVALCLLGSPVNCVEDIESFPDATLTAEQWQQREPVQSDQEDAQAADQRAMNDPSLQRGDVIATSKGFFVFIGDDRQVRTPADFAPVGAPRR
jgi:hypothetical protein